MQYSGTIDRSHVHGARTYSTVDRRAMVQEHAVLLIGGLYDGRTYSTVGMFPVHSARTYSTVGRFPVQ